MADKKITALTADTTPTSDDLLVTVNNPAGTPANRKVTVGQLQAAVARYNGVDNLPSMTGSLTIDFDSGSYNNKNGELTGNVVMGALAKTSSGWCTLTVQQTGAGQFTIDWTSAGFGTNLEPPQPYLNVQEVTRYDLYYDEDFGWTWEFNARLGTSDTAEPIVTTSEKEFTDQLAADMLIDGVTYEVIG